MLALNDEVHRRLTADVQEGEVVLGVPHDIVYPAFRRFFSGVARDFRG